MVYGRRLERQCCGLEIWGKVCLQVAPGDLRFRPVDGVGTDGVLAELDGEALAGHCPGGGVFGGNQSRVERAARSRLRRTCGGTTEAGVLAPNVKMMR
jgi:hypothetical protein